MFTVDGTELDIPNPDPEYKYCWIDGSSRRQVRRYVFGGYSPCEGKDEANSLFGQAMGEVMLDANGRISYQELILMKIPRRKWDDFQIKLRERAIAEDQASRDQFEAETEHLSRYVKPFRTTREEYDDRKAFDTREDRPNVSLAGLDPNAESKE